MYDFNRISVLHGPSIELIVKNHSPYPMVDKGAHGAVFKISEDKCVKIYADEINCTLEAKVYTAAQASPIVPRLYEVGKNYIVMEFLPGTSLREYLIQKGRMPSSIARQILFILKEMERLGFTRLDSALRHMIVNQNKEVKVIDIVYAYTRKDPKPVKLFTELKELGLVEEFMEKVKQLDSHLYEKWRIGMKEFIVL
jgi:predicted Ser/Thr protein kinase